ncbi:DUF421 domain-containing protein [Bacillus horti]|uniref:Uncharacterized membrane protein YcaP (DUF421 family) n=1 Tax=Caldalkalibacillus horti TaxID=77523 RepID=A0ABT9W5W6_9BACI|nr:DUF421 domain-containing protein [Bacillus horti]MDQ0168467.1 uncharacterized membrane protein YcaP (DUF421 family) [Bacillus horti]
MDFIWETIVLTLAGILLLRLTGRKSVAQMTISSTIVLVSVGTVIVQPVIQKNVWKTILAIAIISVLLIIIEFLQMKFNLFDIIFSGKSKVIIKDGKPHTENLMKLRLGIDQLEMRLRQNGISKIEDVQTATLEANGQIGYELMPDAKPLTVGEFKKLMGYPTASQQVQSSLHQQEEGYNLFDEVKADGHDKLIPKRLE